MPVWTNPKVIMPKPRKRKTAKKRPWTATDEGMWRGRQKHLAEVRRYMRAVEKDRDKAAAKKASQ
jgi:hypothetical protein